MLSGIPRSLFALSIAVVASPSEAFGAKLNEIVTTGNCPWWLIARGAVVDSKCVNALSGTAAPFALLTLGMTDEATIDVADGPVVPALAPEELVAVVDEPDDVAVADRT